MCYGCTQCGKCGKFGEGSNLASTISIPCLKCGAVVDGATGRCTECGFQAILPAGTRKESASAQVTVQHQVISQRQQAEQ